MANKLITKDFWNSWKDC